MGFFFLQLCLNFTSHHFNHREAKLKAPYVFLRKFWINVLEINYVYTFGQNPVLQSKYSIFFISTPHFVNYGGFDISNYYQTYHFTYQMQIKICATKSIRFISFFTTQMTGNENLTKLHVETALAQCKEYISYNSSLQTEQPTIVYNILALCPKNCSNNGMCNKGIQI